MALWPWKPRSRCGRGSSHPGQLDGVPRGVSWCLERCTGRKPAPYDQGGSRCGSHKRLWGWKKSASFCLASANTWNGFLCEMDHLLDILELGVHVHISITHTTYTYTYGHVHRHHAAVHTVLHTHSTQTGTLAYRNISFKLPFQTRLQWNPGRPSRPGSVPPHGDTPSSAVPAPSPALCQFLQSTFLYSWDILNSVRA